MFLVSFGVLVFCRSLRENCGLKVEITKKLKSFGRAIERIVPSALDPKQGMFECMCNTPIKANPFIIQNLFHKGNQQRFSIKLF
jgi:hypothetical protein